MWRSLDETQLAGLDLGNEVGLLPDLLIRKDS